MNEIMQQPDSLFQIGHRYTYQLFAAFLKTLQSSMFSAPANAALTILLTILQKVHFESNVQQPCSTQINAAGSCHSGDRG